MGPEALVVMKDVCRFSEDEAVEVLRWAALALLHAGLKEAGKADSGQAARPAAPQIRQVGGDCSFYAAHQPTEAARLRRLVSPRL